MQDKNPDLSNSFSPALPWISGELVQTVPTSGVLEYRTDLPHRPPALHKHFTRLEIINQTAALIVHFILIRRWSGQYLDRERQVPGAVSASREEALGAAANTHQTGPRAAQLLYWIHIIC